VGAPLPITATRKGQETLSFLTGLQVAPAVVPLLQLSGRKRYGLEKASYTVEGRNRGVAGGDPSGGQIQESKERQTRT
jgi:hypothetical protein